MHFELTGKRIFVAGHRGMVGSAIVRRLATEQCEVIVATRQELNLLDQAATRTWMQLHKPDAVVLAAAKVGGILANSEFPAEFLYENLNIATNVIHAAHEADVSRLLNLGSSCIYPKFADQPIKEESLLAGSLEPTNEWYAIAKIAGLKLAEAYRIQYGRDYISAMPTNLYGPGDNYDLQSSHVLPALIRKVHEAMEAKSRSITIWGSGNPKREFLHADDCADACVFLLKNYSANLHVNVGSGTDISIADLAQLISDILGYQGSIQHDLSKPDGTPRKLMSNGRLASMGWRPSIALRDGIALAYRDFIRGEVRR
jgi:GDP-L-fucose synthase